MKGLGGLQAVIRREINAEIQIEAATGPTMTVGEGLQIRTIPAHLRHSAIFLVVKFGAISEISNLTVMYLCTKRRVHPRLFYIGFKRGTVNCVLSFVKILFQ